GAHQRRAAQRPGVARGLLDRSSRPPLLDRRGRGAARRGRGALRRGLGGRRGEPRYAALRGPTQRAGEPRLRGLPHATAHARDGLGATRRRLELLRPLLADRPRRLPRPVVVAALVLRLRRAPDPRRSRAASEPLRRARGDAPRVQGRAALRAGGRPDRQRRPRPALQPPYVPVRGRPLLRAALRAGALLVTARGGGFHTDVVLVRRPRLLRRGAQGRAAVELPA